MNFGQLISPLFSVESLPHQRDSIDEELNPCHNDSIQPPSFYHGIYSFQPIVDANTLSKNLTQLQALLHQYDCKYPQQLLKFFSVDVNSSYHFSQAGHAISMVQLNMLADNLSGGDPNLGGFTAVDPTCLDISTRKWRILQTILTKPQHITRAIQREGRDEEPLSTSSALLPDTMQGDRPSNDIICLQELDMGLYLEFFGPILAHLGYYSIYRSKLRPTAEGRPLFDGCAIFSRYPILTTWWMPLCIDTNNIVLMAAIKVPHAVPIPPLIIATTHLKSTKSQAGEIVRAKQLSLGLSYLYHFRCYHARQWQQHQGEEQHEEQLHNSSLSSPTNVASDMIHNHHHSTHLNPSMIPVLLAGDFNAAPYPTPSSPYPPYTYALMLLQGITDYHHICFTPTPSDIQQMPSDHSPSNIPSNSSISTGLPHWKSFFDVVLPPHSLTILQSNMVLNRPKYDPLLEPVFTSFHEMYQKHIQVKVPRNIGYLNDLIELIQIQYLMGQQAQLTQDAVQPIITQVGDNDHDHNGDDNGHHHESSPTSNQPGYVGTAATSIVKRLTYNMSLTRDQLSARSDSLLEALAPTLPSLHLDRLRDYINRPFDDSNGDLQLEPSVHAMLLHSQQSVPSSHLVNAYGAYTASILKQAFRIGSPDIIPHLDSNNVNTIIRIVKDNPAVRTALERIMEYAYLPPLPDSLSTINNHDEDKKEISVLLEPTFQTYQPSYDHIISPTSELYYGPFTTIKTRRDVLVKHPLDYILSSATPSMTPVRIGTIPPLLALPHNGLPHHVFPSDHLPLFATFVLHHPASISE